MALTLSQISSALSTYFAPELDRQFNRTAVTAQLLRKVPGQGKQVSWDVRFSRTTHASNFTEGSDVDAGEFQTDTTVPAVLSWGQYRAAFSLSGISVAAAAASPGSAIELLNQFETNLVDAASDLISQINDGIWNADGTGTKLVGLDGGGALAASGTYAGINRATYAEWKSNVVANGGTPRALTKALMDKVELSIFKAISEPPDIIVATPEAVQKYEAIFDSMTRVLVERGDFQRDRPTAGAPWTPANSGYTGLSYKGIPIFRDRNCPAGKMFFLNTRYLELAVLPQMNLGTSPRVQAVGLAGAPGNETGISAKVESLAKTGDADKFQLVAYLQTKVRKPAACGVLADIDET